MDFEPTVMPRADLVAAISDAVTGFADAVATIPGENYPHWERETLARMR